MSGSFDINKLYLDFGGDEKREEEMLDAVYNEIDDLLLAGDFEVANQILVEADIERMSELAMLAVLTITLRACLVLSARAALYEKVEKRIWELRPAEADGLLRGLKGVQE